MTILQVNKFFYRRGGADYHFLDLIDLLEDKGEKVVVFSMKDKRNLYSPYSRYFVSHAEFGEGGLKAVAATGRLIYSLEAKKKISALIRDEKPDLAHLHLIYHHLSPSILVALKKAKIPTVMTLHDWKLLCPAYSLFTKGEVCERCRGGHYIECCKNRCIKNSKAASFLGSIEAYIHHTKKYYENYIDLLIAPSRFVKDKFVEFGWPKDKIKILPHFLSLGFPRVEKAPSLPAEMRFAYIGRLSAEKGIEQLVNYWIKEKLPYGLDVYGDGPLRSKLIKIVAASKPDTPINLHGQMRRENIFAGLDRFTAVIMPSLSWETFGLTAIESYARGIPTVMSGKGALAELAEKSKSGILFNWERNDLSNALVQANSQALRDRAVAYMTSNHLADNYYTELSKIYAELRRK